MNNEGTIRQLEELIVDASYLGRYIKKDVIDISEYGGATEGLIAFLEERRAALTEEPVIEAKNDLWEAPSPQRKSAAGEMYEWLAKELSFPSFTTFVGEKIVLARAENKRIALSVNAGDRVAYGKYDVLTDGICRVSVVGHDCVAEIDTICDKVLDAIESDARGDGAKMLVSRSWENTLDYGLIELYTRHGYSCVLPSGDIVPSDVARKRSSELEELDDLLFQKDLDA